MKSLSLSKSMFSLFLTTFSIGCATTRVGPMAILYSDVQTGLVATSNVAGTRFGEACLTSYLGLISTGDASIEAARREGGIVSITSVDESAKSVLGFIYRKHCTIVRGQ